MCSAGYVLICGRPDLLRTVRLHCTSGKSIAPTLIDSAVYFHRNNRVLRPSGRSFWVEDIFQLSTNTPSTIETKQPVAWDAHPNSCSPPKYYRPLIDLCLADPRFHNSPVPIRQRHNKLVSNEPEFCPSTWPVQTTMASQRLERSAFSSNMHCH